MIPLDRSFRDLLEAAPDAIVISDTEGRIVLLNRQCERLFGYARADLLGKTIEVFVPPRLRAAHAVHRASYGEYPKTRLMGTTELLALRGDGTEFPAEISLSPLQTEQGMLVISAIRDITERKRFERELQQKNRDLEAANRELESFSYSVSHDLRAPVRAMAGFGNMLMEEFGARLPAEALATVRRITENALKMRDLIDGLLSLATVTREPLAKSVISPENIVRKIISDLAPEMNGRAVAVDIGKLPDCEADPVLLPQVFANLLSNAVKYTNRRERARIEIGARQEDGKNIYFVRDNGAGFDMQYADRLFGVFQRLHTAEQFEGTGVGLALAQRIIHRHGGRIWAEAQPEKGATFYFTLAPD